MMAPAVVAQTAAEGEREKEMRKPESTWILPNLDHDAIEPLNLAADRH